MNIALNRALNEPQIGVFLAGGQDEASSVRAEVYLVPDGGEDTEVD